MGTKLRASNLQGKHSTAELYPLPQGLVIEKHYGTINMQFQ